MTLPAPPACLNRPYCARPNQSGGTLIAEDVREPNEHRRRLLDPDEYRPCSCLNCRGSRLHAHSYRERRIKIGGGISTEEQVRRYRCVACRAVGPRNRPCHDAAPVGGPVGFERPSPDRSLGRPLPRAVRRDRASPDRLEPRRPRAGAAEPGTSRGRLCAEPNRGLDPSANARFALALARASRPMQIPPFSVFRPGRR
jgi:hypothetical protein